MRYTALMHAMLGVRACAKNTSKGMKKNGFLLIAALIIKPFFKKANKKTYSLYFIVLY